MLYTRKREGAPIEILDFRSGELEAREIITEMVRHPGEGVAWDEIAILYCSNALSLLFKEALMWARISLFARRRRGRLPKRRNQVCSRLTPANGQTHLEFGHVFLPDWKNRDFLPAYMTTRRTAARACRDQSRHEVCDDLAFRFANWTPAAVRLHEEHSGRTRSRVGSDSLSAFRGRRVGRHHTATAPLAPREQQRSDDERKHCFAGRL